tara:strand:+ start:21575 stop:22678 length:1104 start_codon:yes stop_codon:yes gene_type:complete
MKFEWGILQNEIDDGHGGVASLLKRMDSSLKGEGLPLEGFEFLNSAQEMLRITREIEDAALMAGPDSTVFVGFQNIDKLQNEYDRYRDLISNGVTIHAFGTGDSDSWAMDACTSWNPLSRSTSKVENQWMLVAKDPTPIAFIGWEVSRGIFGEGKLSDPGKLFEGFASSDSRIVDSLIQHLEATRIENSQKNDSSSKNLKEKTSPYSKIMLVTENKSNTSDGGKILGYEDSLVNFCQENGAEAILYDISACSYFVKPVPAESDNLLKTVIDTETVENLGRLNLAAQGRVFENAGLKTSYLLPEKNGFKHLIERATQEKIDLIILDDYYSSPRLMDRIAGNSLSNIDQSATVEVMLYKELQSQSISVA